jgi:uncharacterized protein (TIGR02246 family)
MKRWACILVCTVGISIAAGRGFGQTTTPRTESAVSREGAAEIEQAISGEELAIRKTIDSYVAAFNRGDAKALAAHWGRRGEMTTSEDETLRGRESLEKHFAASFTENKALKLELLGTVIEFMSPSVAVEKGVARVVGPDQEPSETQYVAVHVATEEGWKIDSVREQEPEFVPPSNYEKLEQLQWMVGNWSDAEETGSVETNCRWTTNRNFLVNTFRVYVEDRLDMEGTQIIGWDPHRQAIRSWLFDSDGGFGVGRWTGNGNRWTVQTLHVLPDGRQASSTSIYERIDDNTMQFRSIGRQVDGELLPNVEPFSVVRSSAK